MMIPDLSSAGLLVLLAMNCAPGPKREHHPALRLRRRRPAAGHAAGDANRQGTVEHMHLAAVRASTLHCVTELYV